MVCSYTITISLSCIFETVMIMLSTEHGTAAARIWFDIVYSGRQKGGKPCWFCTSSLYQNEMGQLSMARLGSGWCWHVWSCLYCHCWAVLVPCWHSFKWQCKRGNSFLDWYGNVFSTSQHNTSGATTYVLPAIKNIFAFSCGWQLKYLCANRELKISLVQVQTCNNTCTFHWVILTVHL